MSLNQLFTSIFDTSLATSISIVDFLLCMGVSLLMGLFLAMTYTYRTKHTKSFVMTLAMLPAIVCVVIMMVNGNLGAGVAVAGAFSLVRFRSAPGTAKEIGTIFIAMGTGLATGMGYLGYAIVFTVILGIISMLYTMSNVGDTKNTERTMRITIPENLDYTNVFDDLFEKYTKECQLMHVKTASMGSLFKLTYDVRLKNLEEEKNFIDELRCRNGNLEITMARQSTIAGEL